MSVKVHGRDECNSNPEEIRDADTPHMSKARPISKKKNNIVICKTTREPIFLIGN